MERSARSEHGSPIRRVSDGRQLWTVYEHTPDYDRRSGPTLVFDSPEVVRRVRTFPPDWHRLPDHELLALSESI